MNIPIVLALLSLVCDGIVRFFTKIAGVNQYYGPSYVLFQGVGLCVVAIVIHLVQRHPLDLSPRMTGVAFLGGVIAAIAISALVLAFRMGGEGSVLFPIAGMGILVAAILSFVIYREPVTATKLLGLGLGVSSIIVLSR